MYGATSHLLRDGFREYVFLPSSEPIPADAEVLPLDDPRQAEAWLSDFAQDAINLRVMRELLPSASRNFWPLSTEQLVRQVAQRIVDGHFKVARAPTRIVPGYTLAGEKKAREESEAVEETKGLFLQVIEDVTGDPVEGIELEIQLPDESKQKKTTDGEGRIEINNLKDGRVRITSVIKGVTLADTVALVKQGILPSAEAEGEDQRRPAIKGRFLVRLTPHKVQDGDTLESIAAQYELTQDELTKFNFDTTDPKKIELHLFSSVGCTTRDENGNLLLTSDAEPGLVYIPRMLQMDWVALQQRHILRVKQVSTQPLYSFSA